MGADAVKGESESIGVSAGLGKEETTARSWAAPGSQVQHEAEAAGGQPKAHLDTRVCAVIWLLRGTMRGPSYPTGKVRVRYGSTGPAWGGGRGPWGSPGRKHLVRPGHTFRVSLLSHAPRSGCRAEHLAWEPAGIPGLSRLLSGSGLSLQSPSLLPVLHFVCSWACFGADPDNRRLGWYRSRLMTSGVWGASTVASKSEGHEFESQPSFKLRGSLVQMLNFPKSQLSHP